MILYIGWTNLMLMNIFNIHSTINKDKEAVVLIIDSSSVDPEIADYFSKSKSFVNSYIIPTQLTISKYTTRKEKIKHLSDVLFYSKNILRYYESTMPPSLKGFEFDEVYVPGFFYNIVFFLEIINRRNKINHIKFYEFGLGTYTYEIDTLMKNMEFMSARDYLIRTANEYRYRLKFKKKLTEEIYVYEPSLLHPNVTYKPIIIPKVDVRLDESVGYENNPNDDSFTETAIPSKSDQPSAEILPSGKKHFIQTMFRNIPNFVRIATKNRNIIYFSSYGPGTSEEQKLFANLLQLVRTQDIMLKTHTQAPSLFKPLLAKFGSHCFVDTNIYLFESLLSQYDFSNKILVTRLSSAVFHPKLIFGQEPIIILTYKLFQIYKEIGNNLLDKLILRIKNIYSNPEKIMVPTSILEFKLMVKRAQKMMYNSIYQIDSEPASDNNITKESDADSESGDNIEFTQEESELEDFSVSDESLLELLEDDSNTDTLNETEPQNSDDKKTE